MKINSHLKSSKVRIFGTLLIFALALYPTMSYAIGWETVPGESGSFQCNEGSTPGVFSVTTERFYLFGICWSERQIFRDANGNELSGYPCQ